MMNGMRCQCLNLLHRLKPYKFHQFHSALSMQLQAKVKQIEHQDFVKVAWDNGTTSRFPFVYLREKCQCDSCYHKPSNQRILQVRNLDLNSRPEVTNIKENGTKIEVIWQDKHVSEFDSNWLYKKILPEVNTSHTSETLIREGAEIWDKNFKIPTFEFELMLNEDQVLLDWLLTIFRFGVAKVIGVPRKLGQLERLGSVVGFLKNTHFGETHAIRSEPNASNLANTSIELHPHTDLPYYEFKPGVILLQCIEQVKSEGGENTLIDGFNVVQHFKQEQPRYFDLMVSTPVLWQSIGIGKNIGDFKKTYPRRVIEVGHDGRVARINHDEHVREGFLGVSEDEITEVYHAYKAISEMFFDPRFVVKTKMDPGDMLTFDNDRLLHGRTAFKVKENDTRWVHEAYVDWDILRSKMEVLKEKLHRTDDE